MSAEEIKPGPKEETPEEESKATKKRKERKQPVRYELTLKARDLYLLVFGAALVIFAAFTLGALVGRYLGPYPGEKVTAKLERGEMFEPSKGNKKANASSSAEAKKSPEATAAASPTRSPASEPSPPPTGGVNAAAPTAASAAAQRKEAYTPTQEPRPSAMTKPQPKVVPRSVPSPSPEAQPKPSPKPSPKPTPKPTPEATVKPEAKPKAAASPSPSKSSTPPKRALAKQYYAVQVGAYSQKSNATAEVEKLRKMGFDAWMRPPVAGKGKYYSVLVGKKDSARECESLTGELKKKGYRQAYVRRLSESQ